jgi:diacylglycerol kinase
MVLALLAGFLLDLSAAEWLILILLISMVLVAEAFNSGMEKMADEITREKRENIRKLKDYSAAAVLLASMAAVAGGLILFLPKILDLLL